VRLVLEASEHRANLSLNAAMQDQLTVGVVPDSPSGSCTEKPRIISSAVEMM
jgi:hypothetical protein